MLPLYWSHCGSFRARDPDYFERVIGCTRLDTLDDMKRLCAEVVDAVAAHRWRGD